MKLIELVYLNGEAVTGQVDRVPEDPMHIYLKKRIVTVGENSVHKIDFSKLVKATITYYQTGTRVFQQ
jgi:hypothetical protein